MLVFSTKKIGVKFFCQNDLIRHLTAVPKAIFVNFALLCQNPKESSEVKKLMRECCYPVLPPK